MNTHNGIYSIEHGESATSYIGSTAKGFDNRWARHKAMLNQDNHPNKHLQHAWTKYGADSFVFRVLEAVDDTAQLEVREAHWLRVYLEAGARCYNIMPISRSNIKIVRGPRSPEVRAKLSRANTGKAQSRESVERRAVQLRGKPAPRSEEALARVRARLTKVYDGFIAPDGTVYRNVRNLTLFCKEHRLIQGNMLKVHNGERHEHRGWRRVDSEFTRRTFAIAAPDGAIHEGITNMRQFCDDHALDYGSVLQMMSGRTHLKSHRGWYQPDRPPPQRSYTFIAPDGTRYEVSGSLAVFCREHGLMPSKMSQVAAGERRHHQGWTAPGTTLRSYTLRAPDGTVYSAITNVAEFARAHGLTTTALGQVCLGRTKQHKGWRLVE